MNLDEKSGVAEKINTGLDAIRAVATKLAPQVGKIVRTKKPKTDKGSHWGSKNKSQKRNKTRYLMAKKSNKINRQRVKGWKY